MADKIKISQLTQIENLSDDDEFVVIDKSILTGENASITGQTNRATFGQLKDAVLNSASVIGNQKGEPRADGIKGEKGDTGNAELVEKMVLKVNS